jgi:hypothetical protein
MTAAGGSEREILDLETRKLKERGYTIYRGSSELLPPTLKKYAPDAIAIGREPKYVIEIIRDDANDAGKLEALQRQISDLPGWELRVILDSGTRLPPLAAATIADIDAAILGARKVLATGEAAAALLSAWGIFEALGRRLVPEELQRPQMPGSLIQILASWGHIDTRQEMFLRKLAKERDAWIHGDFSKKVAVPDIEAFLNVIAELRNELISEAAE